MYYPFKIVRVVKRAITWFFEEETETIGCHDIDEVYAKLLKGDKVFKLVGNGNYEPYTKIGALQDAIDQLDETFYDCNDWSNKWNRNDDVVRIIKTISNTYLD